MHSQKLLDHHSLSKEILSRSKAEIIILSSGRNNNKIPIMGILFSLLHHTGFHRVGGSYYQHTLYEASLIPEICLHNLHTVERERQAYYR